MLSAAKEEQHVPFLAAACLSENSRLGSATSTNELHRAFGFANSNTVTGLPECLYDFCGRSRSTGKERDSESGLDYFGARYYGSALGRFTSPDPSNLSVDFEVPQSWNRYAYTLNNPLAYTDPNGLWPTPIHNGIIAMAFPGLSSQDVGTLQKASYDSDYNNSVNPTMGLVTGDSAMVSPQDPAASFVHGMSDGVTNQDPMVAEALGDEFIGQNMTAARADQAEWIASGHTGFSPKALTAFGNLLHTVTDRTSPAHAGNQPWYGMNGTQNIARAINHVRRESTPTGPQIVNAVNQARLYFLITFGADATGQATGKKKKEDVHSTFKPCAATDNSPGCK